MTDEQKATAKAAASAVTALFAALAHALDLSPVFVSANFLDLVASAIFALIAVFYAARS